MPIDLSTGGNLVISGISGNQCTWTNVDIVLSAGGTHTASWTTVQGSAATGNTVDATDNCTDGGGNSGWDFAAAPAVDVNPTTVTTTVSTPVVSVDIVAPGLNVVSRQQYGTTVGGTSLSITLPASIANGDLLILHIGAHPTVSPWSESGTSDWIEKDQANETARTQAIFSLDCDGTEGNAVYTFAGGGATFEAASATLYQIRGSNGSTDIALSASNIYSNTTTVSYNTVTPAWGSDENLWILFSSATDEGEIITTFPTNYTATGQNNTLGVGGANASIALHDAYRLNTAASESPGNATLAASEGGFSWSVGVRPDQAGAIDVIPTTVTTTVSTPAVDVQVSTFTNVLPATATISVATPAVDVVVFEDTNVLPATVSVNVSTPQVDVVVGLDIDISPSTVAVGVNTPLVPVTTPVEFLVATEAQPLQYQVQFGGDVLLTSQANVNAWRNEHDWVSTPFPAVISTQPDNLSVPQGGAINLSIVAIGASTYQWYENFEPLIGETAASLSITAPAQNVTLEYTCMAINAAGIGIRSKAGTVTVGSGGFSTLVTHRSNPVTHKAENVTHD